MRSSFNAAKELVNTELTYFKHEVTELSQKSETLSLEEQRSINELLDLSKKCIEMSPLDFRTKCETIVQDLTRKRQDCQTGSLKWLFTRMLFILTRCTRLLHFEKHSEHIEEISLLKLKECLEKIPSHEMSWLLSDTISSKFDDEHMIQDSHQNDDLVICRICEEYVPSSHLETHSYICAHAEKCDIKGVDVNESLLGLSDILEQIIDSCTPSVNADNDSSQSSQVQISLDNCSPKISEWRNKGVEGMFEDIHEMDTAWIEESTPVSFVNIKGFPGVKSQYGPPSSTGSMTSASSTPRAANFDLFWLEHSHSSELEDVQQARNLRLEMSGGFGETASKPTQSSSFSNNNGSNNGDGGNFDCSICLDLAQDPIVTLCGHLFCWPCIYQWLNYHSHSNECPLCKAFIQEEQLIPLYGRGTSSSDSSRSKSLHGDNIPNRPTVQRPEPGPPPDRNQLLQHGTGFIGGFGPAITASFGNITFSFGGFIPSIFNVQMHTLNYGGFHAFQRGDQRHEVSPLLIVGLLFLCALLWE